eukprot:5294993-Pleurochrysis_carterae.AAC.2
MRVHCRTARLNTLARYKSCNAFADTNIYDDIAYLTEGSERAALWHGDTTTVETVLHPPFALKVPICVRVCH